MKPTIYRVLAGIVVPVLFSSLALPGAIYALPAPQADQQPQSSAAFVPLEREMDSALESATTAGNWSALGSNPAGTNGALSSAIYNPLVMDIEVSGTDVYVGGCFDNAGGDPTADYIAKWNGVSWSGLGDDGASPADGAIKGCVFAIAINGNDVYVGGGLNLWSNGVSVPQANHFAKWDGTNWSWVSDDGMGGSSFNAVVKDIAVDGNNVYVGGQFTNVKNGLNTLTEADYIAKWDGTSWSALGNNGMGDGALLSFGGGRVETVVVLNSDVYAGGTFSQVYNGLDLVPEAMYIAKWDGTNWSALGSNPVSWLGAIGNHVYELATDGSNLYAAGWFSDVNNYGTVLATADYIAKWDGTNWSALGSNGSGDGSLVNGYPASISVDGTDIYIGGTFTDVNNNGIVLTAADFVAKWDALTGHWSALGSDGTGNGSLNTYVHTLGLVGNQLFVGGEFSNVNNNGTVLNTADYIAEYEMGDGIYRVTPNGVSSSPCGHNWANPCDLQYTLNTLASIGDELWVKAGTYKPTVSTDRTVSFALKNGLAIYGGFNGTESLRTQRNPVTNVTILSGEIGAAGIADNSYHVVVGSGTNDTAVLDGFTITAGNADVYPTDDGCGGGMFIRNGSPALTNLVFNGNAGLNGGGLFNDNGSPTLKHVTFSDNTAVLGGGMANWSNSNPLLEDVSFIGNYTSYPGSETLGGAGGGMENQYSSPTLMNVTFSDNTADIEGGGMANIYSSPTLTNVTFGGNSAYYGGGMSNRNNSNPIVTNVTFSGNAATHPVDDTGGGMYNYNNSGPTLTNVIIANSPTGGDCVNNSSTLNSTSANNLIEDAANACGLTNGVNGNIVGLDPNLGPLVNNGGFTQTMALLPGSPAMNAGDNANCPATDQRGVTRPQGSYCDIGAYEFQDAIPPGVVSIVRAGTNPTSAATADFTVTFSEPVTGVGTGDFGLSTTGITGAALTNVTPVSGTTYSVTVNTGSGSGTIRLDLVDDDSIKDANNNPLGGVGAANGNFARGESYTIDKSVAINVLIGGVEVSGSPYYVPPGQSTRQTYPLDAGPVKVVSSNSVPIIAALRDAYLVGGQVESFAQLMGLPKEQLSDTYYFPAYNNVTLSGQLRFANVDSIATTVTVTIGGEVQGTYPLQPNQSQRISYPLDTGPVVIQSSNGAKIIAALRDAFLAAGGQVESFVQLMGLSKEQLSDTYYFPAYNNITLSGQLRFANVDSIDTTVTVTIGGEVQDTYPLQPNQSQRVSYPLDTGPVVIQSSNGARIIAALRDAFVVGGKVESFSQLMGLPAQALSDAYVFPAYNNLTLSGQLRFANVDSIATTVTVTIGGTIQGTYPLQPNQSQRVSYPLDTGPVMITSSNGATIIAALRDAYLAEGGQVVSFVQLMGLPEAALSDTYYFPAYNNVTLSGQLRFGVP